MSTIGALPPNFQWASLVPEFLVTNLQRSLDFWCGHIGFSIVYARPDEGFAYLQQDGSQVMLEQLDPGSRNWVTGPLEPPLGRGINFQIEVADVERVLESLHESAWPLFMDTEEKWYVVADHERGQRQFLVQDPDGYLLRHFGDPGRRSSIPGQTIQTRSSSRFF